ncbi:hypothetical protein Mapa_012185 [Marchantia paleacea]|nr:hypothetical protein Mapa_012185 [Marchantia paleacea]
MKCIRRALLPPRLLPSSSSGSPRHKLKDRIRRSFSVEDEPERISLSSNHEELSVARSLSDIILEHEWVRLHLDEPLPSPRSKHAAVAVGEQMYVIGGRSAEGLVGDIQVLDMREVLWNQIRKNTGPGANGKAPSPPFVGHFVAKWKDMIVVLGGEADLKTSIVQVHAYDFKSDSWSSLAPSGDIPPARIGQSVVQVESKLMMFGGEDASGRMLDEFYVLDLDTLEWECPKTGGIKPAPRKYHAAGCYSGRYIWIFGGKSYATYYKDVFYLDLTTMEWTKQKTKGSVPQIGRARHVGVMVDNNFYIVGGENRGQEMVDTLRLDVKNREWSIVTMIEAMSALAHDGLSVVRIEMDEKDYLVAFGGHGTLLSNQVYVMLVTISRSSETFGKTLSRSSSESSIRSTKESFKTSSRVKESASPTGHLQLQYASTSSSSTDLSCQTTPSCDNAEKQTSSVSEKDMSTLSSLAREGTLSMEDIRAMMEVVVRSDGASNLSRSQLSGNGEKSAADSVGEIEEFIVIENAIEEEGTEVAPGAGASETKGNDLITDSSVQGLHKGRNLKFPSSKKTTDSKSPRLKKLDSHDNQNLVSPRSLTNTSPRSTSVTCTASETDQYVQETGSPAPGDEHYLAAALQTVRELHRQVELLNKSKDEQEKDLQTRFRSMEAMATKLEVTMQQQLMTELKLQETLQLHKQTEKKLQEVSQLQKNTERKYQSMKQQKSEIESQYRLCLLQKQEIDRHLTAMAIRDD